MISDIESLQIGWNHKTGVRTRSQLVRIILEHVLLVVIVASTICIRGSTPPLSPPGEGQQIGQIVSVRKVLENRYFVSRYPQIHYYLVYFAIRTFDRTYCVEYETPVLDEIDDLFSAKDTDVDVVLKGRSLTLRTPKGRDLKARFVDQKQC